MSVEQDLRERPAVLERLTRIDSHAPKINRPPQFFCTLYAGVIQRFYKKHTVGALSKPGARRADYGAIHFGIHSSVSPFVRVSHTVDGQHIVDFIHDRWQIPKPRVLISIIGGAENFKASRKVVDAFKAHTEVTRFVTKVVTQRLVCGARVQGRRNSTATPPFGVFFHALPSVTPQIQPCELDADATLPAAHIQQAPDGARTYRGQGNAPRRRGRGCR